MRVSYTPTQREAAIATYRRLGSYTQTIRAIGYPSLHVLHDWVKEGPPSTHPRPPACPSRHYSWEFKAQVVERVLAGEMVKDVAADLDMPTHVQIYKWVQKWRVHGERGVMTKSEKAKADNFPTRASMERGLPDDIGELKQLAADLMVQWAVLERELELVKKDVGVIPGQLTNLHKAEIVDERRIRYPLPALLRILGLRPSSYQYCKKVLQRPVPHLELRAQIAQISCDSMHTYGSPRIWLTLRQAGIRVSEKVVRRLMKEERIPVHYAHRKRKYTSYAGEISPAPADHVKRRFRAAAPNQLWLTDVSEFAGPDGKVYLSPMIDCFDGKVVAWKTLRTPSKALTQRMLADAIGTLPAAYREQLRAGSESTTLRVHSDRGGHYRGADWIEMMNSAGLTRSMGRKGKSGDNAACEGFFGRMKTEMFYGRQWENIAQIESAIERYMHFYNNERIKTVLGGVTIASYRDRLEVEPSKKTVLTPFSADNPPP